MGAEHYASVENKRGNLKSVIDLGNGKARSVCKIDQLLRVTESSLSIDRKEKKDVSLFYGNFRHGMSEGVFGY